MVESADGSDARKTWGLVASSMLVGAALSFLLPAEPIALDGALALVVLRVSDMATWTVLPPLCVLAVAVLASRPGLSARRRAVEAGAILMVMGVTLAGNAMLNEHVVKPALAAPRPNIVALVEAGELGAAIDTPADFYALGDKQARRDFLAGELDDLRTPALSEPVRVHWIHETGYSMPSGHATAAVTFAAMMVGLALAWAQGWRRAVFVWGSPAWALAVVYTRPLLRVHTALDVTLGTLAGLVWGLVSVAVIVWLAERLGGPSERD